MELKSKKMLVNRSEIIGLTKTLELLQSQITSQNSFFAGRLETIEQNINKLKIKPKTRPKSAVQVILLIAHLFCSLFSG